MLPLHPGIYPNLQFSEEAIAQTIHHCVAAYKIESYPTTREQRVIFSLKNLSGIRADAIACISFNVFDSLYRAGCTRYSRILLEVTEGRIFDPRRPMGSQYALQIPLPLQASESGISHAFAFVDPEQSTGCLCFYLTGAIGVKALDKTLSSRFSRQNEQEASMSIIQKIINYILSLNCFKSL